MGTHDAKNTVRVGHVHNLRAIALCAALNPIQVVHGLGGTGDDIELIQRKANNGQVAFESTSLIEHAGIDHSPDWQIHIIATETLEKVDGIAALANELGKAGLVKDSDIFASGAMFSRMTVEPILPAKGIFHFRLAAIASKPVRSLPAVFAAEA